jgi:hypothetical protein
MTLNGNDGAKLFAVKSDDFGPDADGLLRWADMTTVSAEAGCPTISQPNPVGLTYVVARIAEDAVERRDVCLAAKIAFLIGVKEISKDKKMCTAHRATTLVEALGVDIPDWVSGCDRLTQRTYTALACARAVKEGGPKTMSAYTAWQDNILSKDGIFAQHVGREAAIVRAVEAHFLSLTSGTAASVPTSATHSCVITGQPVENLWRVIDADGLHGIKTSAFSYRAGRSESRFKEDADVHISPVSYAEYKLRGRSPAADADGTQVRLFSTITNGLFGSQYIKGGSGSLGQGADVSLFDAMRQQTGKRTITPMESYRAPIRIARYEKLGSSFADRVDLIEKVIQTCRRLGRPIHLFNGIPRMVPDFFHGDCLGRDVEALIGGPGLRIEELEPALRNLELVVFMSRPRSEGGLGAADLAKEYCFPSTRLRASVLAWGIASQIKKTPDAERYADAFFNDIVPKEIKRMTESGIEIPELKLARLARSFQKGPSFDESSNVLDFVVRTAFEQAESLYKAGRRGKETAPLYVAAIAEALYTEGKRRTETKGFFSSKETRPVGSSINSRAEAIATAFVEDIWFGLLGGRPCKHDQRRQIILTYRFGFKKYAA